MRTLMSINSARTPKPLGSSMVLVGLFLRVIVEAKRKYRLAKGKPTASQEKKGTTRI